MTVAQPQDVDVYATAQISPLGPEVQAWLTGPDKPTPHASGTIAARRYEIYDLATLKDAHPARNRLRERRRGCGDRCVAPGARRRRGAAVPSRRPGGTDPPPADNQSGVPLDAPQAR